MNIDKKKKLQICITIFGANVFIINDMIKNNNLNNLLDDGLLKSIHDINELYSLFSIMSKENGIIEEIFRSGCIKMSRKILSISSSVNNMINHIEQSNEAFSSIAISIIDEINESKTGSSHKSKTLQKAISLMNKFIIDIKNITN